MRDFLPLGRPGALGDRDRHRHALDRLRPRPESMGMNLLVYAGTAQLARCR